MDAATSRNEATDASTGRLSPGDWARAALTAIGEGGLGAVAVEPIAARLGATKGSFYWHFRNRDALVDAALSLWEEEHTEGVIAAMEGIPDPMQRLRGLMALVMASAAHDRIEIALAANGDDPMVAPVMRRITERRITYVASLFSQMGLPAEAARHRALFAVSAYLGHLQLAHVAPEVLPTDTSAWARHLDRLIDALVAP
ncbi:MAG TPA: TetR/AcrR family transcriptional regulator [Euzebya sp.]|nr:TetR/AcrR family transcriptional regulator [Euzebya sp.]